MTTDPNLPLPVSQSSVISHAEPPKLSLWQQMGGTSLAIAALLHVILLIAGLLIVFESFQPTEQPEPDFIPQGANTEGSGERGIQHQLKQKILISSMSLTQPRIACTQDTVSNLTIPNSGENFSEVSPLERLAGDSMSRGLSGSGDAWGNHNPHGNGHALSPGLSGKSTPNPFGSQEIHLNALIGTFYNLNRDSHGNDTAMDNPKQWSAIHDFVSRNWKDSELRKFEKAPKPLYQTKLYMPALNAAEAPRAFDMTPDPHPRWVVVYRGTVIAPKSGNFRFVGAGDDTLTVRFNGHHVFDFGFIPATVPFVGFATAIRSNERLKGDFRNCPMQPPVTFYQYPTTHNWNSQIGGMAVGPSFMVQAGRSYPVEILISEGWGGLFAATLLIEEVGANYAKSSTGSPVLPIFRTDQSAPEIKGENAPPYDPNAPSWKVLNTSGFNDI